VAVAFIVFGIRSISGLLMVPRKSETGLLGEKNYRYNRITILISSYPNGIGLLYVDMRLSSSL
jgi:hypothetical protein